VLKHAKDAQERATVFSALKRLAHDEGKDRYNDCVQSSLR